MSSTTPAAPPDPPPDATAEEIEAHIQASRERLASSVDALTAKMDVKEQAKQKARETSERVQVGARSKRLRLPHHARLVRPKSFFTMIVGRPDIHGLHGNRILAPVPGRLE